MPVIIDGTNGITQAGEFNSDSSFGFKNRIINGAMVIDQRNAGASVTPADGAYTLDRWKMLMYNSASKYSVQQNAGSVTPPVGFKNYLGITSSSAYSVASTDLYGMQQRIEGFNTSDLDWGTANAKTVTLSFWVRSSLTGTFGGAISNSAGNRSYPFSYTINSANTWEYETITIPGDTSGTWVGATNGIGMVLYLMVGTGSTFSTTAGAWAAGEFYSVTGATSVVGTNGATFYITGVQLEVGSTATSFDYRPYGTELQLCQRYYQYIGGNQGTYTNIAVGVQFNGTTAYVGGFLGVTMRSAPTFAITGTAGTDFRYLTNADGDLAPTSIANDNSRANSFTLNIGTSGRTAGQGCRFFNITTTGSVTFSAEL
jgi:hypothetical protein